MSIATPVFPETPKEEKKIKVVRLYTMKSTTFEDGSTELDRRNDGFHPNELLGLLELTQLDIIDQIRGVVRPDVTKRTVIED